MASVTRESIGNLHEKITVKLEKQDYLPEFEKDIKSYSKRANIPGFRKGMVPIGMIRKMVGKELYTDVVIKSAEKELRNYLEEEKVDYFGQPLFLNDDENFPVLNLQDPAEYEFLFEVGLRPQVEINLPKETDLKLYKVQVKPEDIDQRIDNLQNQFGNLKPVETIENGENIINFSVTRVDQEGQPVEGGLSANSSLYVKVFSEDFQEKLNGKKKDDVLRGVLGEMVDPEKYGGFYENIGVDPEDKETLSSEVEIKISDVNTLEKLPLNEEFFKKAYPALEIKTEEEFRKAIEEDEQKNWDRAAKNFLDHNVHHLLMEIPVALPEDFLKKMMADPKKPSTPEEVNKAFPEFSKQLKWSLISQKIIQDHNLSISEDEIREDIKSELKNYFQNMNLGESSDDGWLDDYVNRVMADKKQQEQRIDKLMVEKVFDWALTQISIPEIEISQEDFRKEISEHQHHH